MSTKPPRRITIAAILLLAVFAALAVFLPRTLQFPYLEIEVPGSLTVAILAEGQSKGADCEHTLHNMIASFLAVCPQCRVNAHQCLQALSPEQTALLSEEPLNHYSARMPHGVTVYQTTDIDIAAYACRESERKSVNSVAPVICHAPGAPRPVKEQHAKNASLAHTVTTGLGLLAASLIASWFVCWLIIRFENLHAHLSHDHTDGGPQKFHTTPTPRIGGIALMAGLLVAAAAITVFEGQLKPLYRFSPGNYHLLIIASLPAFLGGLIEDVTKRVSVIDRLLLTMASGVLAAWLLGAVLSRLGLPGIDVALTWLPLAILFTAVAVGGITNAINIIDGYNGLAGGYAVIVLLAFAWVSAQTQDTLLLHASLALIGALAGFLAWNWPKGKLFLGDGGAYLLGFLLAELSVLLVVRNPEVSPWFPVLLLIYPIFETFFSIYRKRYLRGHSPGQPDGLHFHMLIYKRVIPWEVRYRKSLSKTSRNSRVAKYFWAPALVIAATASMAAQSTTLLMLLCAGYCSAYLFAYRKITRWKLPKVGSV